jgi:hypothetical protein
LWPPGNVTNRLHINIRRNIHLETFLLLTLAKFRRFHSKFIQSERSRKRISTILKLHYFRFIFINYYKLRHGRQNQFFDVSRLIRRKWVQLLCLRERVQMIRLIRYRAGLKIKIFRESLDFRVLS